MVKEIKNSRLFRMIILILLSTIFLLFITLTGGSLGLAYGIYKKLSSDLPSISGIDRFNPPQVSEVYSEDGVLIGRFYKEKRYLVPFERIPRNIITAIITAEDNQFYEHQGVNIRGIIRAFIQNLKSGKVVQGGSTITQQITRELFLSKKRTYSRKIKEILLAYSLEKKITKNKILELYLNTIYFGHRTYGIEAASQVFFNKHVGELTLAECALLAGLPRAPNRYSPYRNPERSIRLRNNILARMFELGYISREELEKARQEKLSLEPLKSEEWFAPYFVEYVRKILASELGDDMVMGGGLRIYTTLNRRMQIISEKAVRWGLSQHQKRLGRLNPPSKHSIELYSKNLPEEGNVIVGTIKSITPQYVKVEFGYSSGIIPRSRLKWIKNWRSIKPGQLILLEILAKVTVEEGGYRYDLDVFAEPEAEAALLSIDPRDGAIKAMVGGYDYNRNNFNRAIQAKRQPGSAFKPIICSAAIDNGYTPADIIYDTPIIEFIPGTRKPWKPVNFDGTFQGPMTVRQAMEKSRNVVMIKLLKNIGVDLAIRYGKQFGIKSKLEPNLSLALGTSVLSLEDLVSAYTVFATIGKHATPYAITSVRTSRGQVLKIYIPEVLNALNHTSAYLVNNIMQGIVEHGTGQKAKKLHRHLAGKTGTTDDYKDAWFIGYSPNLLAGVWVGFDDFHTLGRMETGSRAALPIWIRFMKKALGNSPNIPFEKDYDIVERTIDYDTGLLATSKCHNVILEKFKRGTAPKQYCNAHTFRKNFTMIDLEGLEPDKEHNRNKRKLFSSD